MPAPTLIMVSVIVLMLKGQLVCATYHREILLIIEGSPHRKLDDTSLYSWVNPVSLEEKPLVAAAS